MPLTSLPTTELERITWWFDGRGDAQQVAVAILDAAWEPRAEATQVLGPFDDAMEGLREARRQARALADRQMPGQTSLGI